MTAIFSLNCTFGALFLQHLGARNLVWAVQDLWEGLKYQELPLAVLACKALRMGPQVKNVLSRAGSVPRLDIIAATLIRLFIMANLILLFFAFSDGWPPLLIFCSWRVAPLFWASSRSWFLITGKARSWSEETALQEVRERWPSWFMCEKTKPLFPSVASFIKSTAAHTDVASKGNKMSPAPASRLALLSHPSLLWVFCAPWRYLLPLEQALCCWCSSRTGTHFCSQGVGRSKEEAPGAYPHSLRGSSGIYRWESTVTYQALVSQKPDLPKTRAYLFTHHLHLVFSMLFGEKNNKTNQNKNKTKKNLAKIIFGSSDVFSVLRVKHVCFFFPSGSEMKKAFFDFFFKINSV